MTRPRYHGPNRLPSQRTRLGATALVVIAACWPLAGCSTGGRRSAIAKKDNTPAQSRLKYELALQHFEGGRTKQAIDTVKEAIRAYPTSPRQFLLLSHCYIEQGKLVSAREAAESALRCDPESSEADYSLGVIAERGGDLDLALEHYSRARSRGHGAVDYVVAEAECLATSGRSTEAIALISGQIDRFDSDGTLEMLLAQINLLDGDNESALREFASALERSDCDSERLRDSYTCALLVEEYGQLLASEGHYEQAIAVLRPHVAAHDGAPASAIAALGASYLQTDRVGDALLLLAAQTKRHPNSVICWMLFARASILGGDWVTARRTADTLVRLAPDSAPAHMLRGFVYWKMNDAQEAIESLSRSLSLDSDDATSHCLLAQVFDSTGHDDASAERQYARAFEIDPKQACGQRTPKPTDDDERMTPLDPLPLLSSPATVEARLP